MKKGFSFVKQCNSFGMAYNRKGPSQIMYYEFNNITTFIYSAVHLKTKKPPLCSKMNIS